MNDTADALLMLGKGYKQDEIIRELPSVMSGFTPAPDVLITQYGFITALVWGKIWRYCQMSDGVCRAKLETLAEQLGMSTRTIIRHIEPMVEGGYLKDLTPDLKNRPHIYADTGKIRIRISIEAAMTESHSTMTESHSRHDRESLEESINKKQIKKQSTTTAAAKPEAFTVYESNIGPLTPIIADGLNDLIRDYSEAWVIRAITEAVQSNARHFKFICAVLAGYKTRGGPDVPRVKVDYGRKKKQPLDIDAILVGGEPWQAYK